MTKRVYQFQNLDRSPSGVGTVEAMARDFLQQSRGLYDTDQAAIAAIARKAHVSPAALRRFVQPSRRPKSVSLELWQRLRTAYSEFLRGQVAALERDIARVEALDPADRALRDLAAEAEDLARRIREAL